MSILPSADEPCGNSVERSPSKPAMHSLNAHYPVPAAGTSWTLHRLVESYPVGVPRHLDYPNIPASGLLSHARKHIPNQTAVHFLGHEFSYQEMDDAADRLAHWLQNRGVNGGRRVGVLLPNCPEYLIALNAIWRAGGVAVAISPLSVATDVERLLTLTGCRTVITLDLFDGLLATFQRLENKLCVSLRPYLPVWKRALYTAALYRRTGTVRFARSAGECWIWDAIEGSSGNYVPAEIMPNLDPAYILSTGGTTGNPKAVTLSHRNIVCNAWQQMHWIGSSGSLSSMGQETMLAVLPFFHCYGMSTMLTTGCALGAKLIMLPRFEVTKTLRTIERHRPTVFHAVPAMLAALNKRLRRQRADLSSIKWVISGGASLPLDTAREFSSHSGALVVEGYGLSEASPVTHVGPLDGSNQLGTIGLPLPDTDCRIIDLEAGREIQGSRDVGELLIRGPQVMLGYWRNAEATQEVLRDGWLHTGDLARRNEAGFYEIVDRKKDLIITSGFNVYPADVEQTLLECPGIADVAVIGVPDAERGEVVKAFVLLKKGSPWNLGRLEEFSRRRLAKHRRPRIWEQVTGELPRNFLGKIVRRALRNPAQDKQGDCRSQLDPSQKALATEIAESGDLDD